MITEFQKELTEKLESGELTYADASIYTVLLSLVQSSSVEEVFVMLHDVACDLDKREAFEEKFEEASINPINYTKESNGYHKIQAFKDGVKWQQERSYSEEEVIQLLLRLQQTEFYNNLYDWFEQFKKK